MHDSYKLLHCTFIFFFFQAEDGIRDADVTGVQTCALPICGACGKALNSFCRRLFLKIRTSKTSLTILLYWISSTIITPRRTRMCLLLLASYQTRFNCTTPTLNCILYPGRMCWEEIGRAHV